MIIGLVIVILVAVSIQQIMADAAAINELTIHAEDVRLTDIGLTSCDLLVTVNFTNPTGRDLSIVSARFDVFVADSYVGNSSLQHLSIPSKSSKEHDISLTLLYSDIAHAVLKVLRIEILILISLVKHKGRCFTDCSLSRYLFPYHQRIRRLSS